MAACWSSFSWCCWVGRAQLDILDAPGAVLAWPLSMTKATAISPNTPNGSGGWTEKVLHNFGHGEDGNSPQGLSLIFDGAGNLYGTTNTGGMNNAGTVFEMSPNGSGGWFEKTLHFFGNGNDGMGPTSSLIFDANGNLYGTTLEGGTNGAGVVFEMMPNGSGGWTEIVLHNFGTGDDGAFPQAGVILDGAGNLYGTTGAGGIQSDGTVFEVTP